MISKIPSPGLLGAGVSGLIASFSAEASMQAFFRKGDLSNALSQKLQDMGYEKKMANRLLLVAVFVVPFFATTLLVPSIVARLGQRVSYKAAACYAAIDLSVYTLIRIIPIYFFELGGFEYLKNKALEYGQGCFDYLKEFLFQDHAENILEI